MPDESTQGRQLGAVFEEGASHGSPRNIRILHSVADETMVRFNGFVISEDVNFNDNIDNDASV
jgi:hypothetical protein